MSTFVPGLPPEVPPPPRIASFSGLIPTLRNAGLVSESWQDAVSLAVASGQFAAEVPSGMNANGDTTYKLLTAEAALALAGTYEKFVRDVRVIHGDWFVPSFSSERTDGGIVHRPIGCGDASLWAPCDVTPGTKETQDQPPIVEMQPFQVYADDTCSTWAPDLEERKRRAFENLERHQSNRIADELWTGDMAAAQSWPNLSFAGDATDLNALGGGVTPSTLALGALQEALAQGLGDGQSGFIHATRTTVQKWYADGNLWYAREADADFWTGDGYLVDAWGNVIVSSGGYDGSAPTGGAVATTNTPWAYATGPIVVRLGGVNFVPGDWAGAAPALTRNNDVTIFAERAVTYELDPCTMYAIQLDLCCSDCQEGGD